MLASSFNVRELVLFSSIFSHMSHHLELFDPSVALCKSLLGCLPVGQSNLQQSRASVGFRSLRKLDYSFFMINFRFDNYNRIFMELETSESRRFFDSLGGI
ncbi:hypothetical protein K1719_003419 [Acacia pycnantha]|nr:hypothetical protein K1719_003419 [Acacia pycnantha]